MLKVIIGLYTELKKWLSCVLPAVSVATDRYACFQSATHVFSSRLSFFAHLNTCLGLKPHDRKLHKSVTVSGIRLLPNGVWGCQSRNSDHAAGRTSEEPWADSRQVQEIFLRKVQTDYGAHPASFSMSTVVRAKGTWSWHQVKLSEEFTSSPPHAFMVWNEIALHWPLGTVRYYQSKFSLWFRTAAEGIKQRQSICYWLQYHRIRT